MPAALCAIECRPGGLQQHVHCGHHDALLSFVQFDGPRRLRPTAPRRRRTPALAPLRFAGPDRVFSLLLAGLVIPAQVGMLPLFLMMRAMHLVNTYWGVIIPLLASVFGIFLIRQFMLSVPQVLLEAARIDGAGETRIYWSVGMPLARPILATLAIFTLRTTWNASMGPLIVLSDQSRYTLPVSIASLVGEHAQDVELMMAGSVVTVLPVLILFLVLQRYYIAGLMVGSVKG